MNQSCACEARLVQMHLLREPNPTRETSVTMECVANKIIAKMALGSFVYTRLFVKIVRKIFSMPKISERRYSNALVVKKMRIRRGVVGLAATVFVSSVPNDELQTVAIMRL